MNFELLGFILDVIGKVMVAYAALRVHRRFWKEHKVDEFVFRAMKREQIIGIFRNYFNHYRFYFTDSVKIMIPHKHTEYSKINKHIYIGTNFCCQTHFDKALLSSTESSPSYSLYHRSFFKWRRGMANRKNVRD